MPTIDRVDGFRIIINTDDHGVPHVHIRYGGGWAKISIGDHETPAGVLDPKNMRGPNLITAVRIVDANWERYLAEWRRIHG